MSQWRVGCARGLVDGAVGVLVAPQGRLRLALAVTIAGERITGYELIADPDRLQRLDLAVLDKVAVSDGEATAEHRLSRN